MIEYTVKVNTDGTKGWYLNGKLHREDGPAMECANGDKYWYLNDKHHCEHGPAIEYANGTKEWYLNGKRHHEHGPAIEYANGDKYWYLNDKHLTEQAHKKATTKTTCDGKEVEIDGVVYILKEKKDV